MPAAGVIDTGS